MSVTPTNIEWGAGELALSVYPSYDYYDVGACRNAVFKWQKITKMIECGQVGGAVHAVPIRTDGSFKITLLEGTTHNINRALSSPQSADVYLQDESLVFYRLIYQVPIKQIGVTENVFRISLYKVFSSEGLQPVLSKSEERSFEITFQVLADPLNNNRSGLIQLNVEPLSSQPDS